MTDLNDVLEPAVFGIEEVEEKETAETKTVAEKKTAEKPSAPAPKARRIEETGLKSDDLLKKETLSLDEERDRKFNEMQEQLRRGAIFWGTVIGYEIQEDERVASSNKPTTILVKVKFGDEEVMIPDSEYFEPTFKFSKDDSKLSKAELIKEKRKRIEYQLDAQVCFLLTYLERRELTSEEQEMLGVKYKFNILGSRTKAMEVLRDYYFLHAKKNRNYPEPVKVGDVATAHVLSVRDNMVLLECLGIETRIDEFELSNEVVNNCNDYVKAGDEIPVTIMKYYPVSETKNVPYLKVSARSGVLSTNLSKIKIGNVYKGKVSHRNKTKHIYSVILNNGVNVIVPENRVMGGLELDRNDNVVVTIKKINGPYILATAYKAR